MLDFVSVIKAPHLSGVGEKMTPVPDPLPCALGGSGCWSREGPWGQDQGWPREGLVKSEVLPEVRPSCCWRHEVKAERTLGVSVQRTSELGAVGVWWGDQPESLGGSPGRESGGASLAISSTWGQ